MTTAIERAAALSAMMVRRRRPGAGIAEPEQWAGVDVMTGLPAIRVLTIDDDPDANLLIRHVLGHRGQMDVVSAAGAGEALDLLANTTYDVVVTDVRMPGMTGLQLLDLLEVTSRNLPVIVVTAAVGIDTALEILRGRAAALLFKPLDPDELLRAVTRAARPTSVIVQGPPPEY